jgi:hypothetical protein
MPLFADGLKKIRRNLVLLAAGQRPAYVRIGYFTAEQVNQINRERSKAGFVALNAVIVFQGKHLYESRIVSDGYSVEEVLEQIQSAFVQDAELNFQPPSSVMRNAVKRKDRRGFMVNDEVIFECTSRHPFAALFSVIPRGDGKRERKK